MGLWLRAALCLPVLVGCAAFDGAEELLEPGDGGGTTGGSGGGLGDGGWVGGNGGNGAGGSSTGGASTGGSSSGGGGSPAGGGGFACENLDRRDLAIVPSN